MNMWKLNSSPMNSQWAKEETKGKQKGYLETNENGNTTY